MRHMREAEAMKLSPRFGIGERALPPVTRNDNKYGATVTHVTCKARAKYLLNPFFGRVQHVKAGRV